MLEYLIIALAAFAIGEISRKIKLYFGEKELKITDIKFSLLLFITSFLIPSFGLFTFSSGLIAHNLIIKRNI
ncbi:MAG: hypothetical protein B6U88_03210 [Candidatus Aenigmarchaeota archaeon ex4484_56]|nr:MAG: hypothetical protein B6U88_03210 [Candidatus Aenigmarchaeota archaeon ex4484_56]